MSSDLQNRPFYHEFEFNASRSSGAGGQNVNKVSSKIELRFNVQNSACLTEEEKSMVFAKAGNKISNDGYLQLFCQTSRSQLVNKQQAVKAFFTLLNDCFFRKKIRRPTKVTHAAKLKRLHSKKIQSNRKLMRGQGGQSEQDS